MDVHPTPEQLLLIARRIGLWSPSRTVRNGSAHIHVHRPGSFGIIRRPLPPALMEPIRPEVDGCRVSDLWRNGDASRTTVFELLKIARIEAHPRRVPGSQRPAAFLTGEQEQMMRALIARLKDGATLAQLRGEALGAIERVQSRTVPNDPEPPDETAEPLPLAERLQAIEAAMRTGAPLTTADVRALLLVWPGAAVVQRGKLQARRLGRNHWVIEAAC